MWQKSSCRKCWRISGHLEVTLLRSGWFFIISRLHVNDGSSPSQRLNQVSNIIGSGEKVSVMQNHSASLKHLTSSLCCVNYIWVSWMYKVKHTSIFSPSAIACVVFSFHYFVPLLIILSPVESSCKTTFEFSWSWLTWSCSKRQYT